jgi:hypothetical protein
MVYSSVILVLPLGTLVAQRIANPPPSAGYGTQNERSGTFSRTGLTTNSKKPFLRSWKAFGSAIKSVSRTGDQTQSDPEAPLALNSGIPGGLGWERKTKDHVDRELARIDDEDIELGGEKMNGSY